MASGQRLTVYKEVGAPLLSVPRTSPSGKLHQKVCDLIRDIVFGLLINVRAGSPHSPCPPLLPIRCALRGSPMA